jgi:hypothetical protein
LSPDFTLLLITGVLFGVAVVVFIAWRFSVADALAFVLVAGLFPAVMDFLSSFAVHLLRLDGGVRHMHGDRRRHPRQTR